jgi:hypothetical protein
MGMARVFEQCAAGPTKEIFEDLIVAIGRRMGLPVDPPAKGEMRMIVAISLRAGRAQVVCA